MLHLDPGEQIVLQVRKHWLVFAMKALVLIVLMLAPFIIRALVPLPPFITIPGNTNFLFLFFAGIWLLVVWVLLFIFWTNYFLDMWVVTNRRVMDIDQISLFNRDVSTFRLDNIEDITVEMHGILSTMLGYGTIIVETAGERRILKMSFMPHPEAIKQAMLELQEKCRAESHGGQTVQQPPNSSPN